MQVHTQSIHFDADAKLLEFIERKLAKLETFYDKIISADVMLRLEKTAQIQDKIAEIKLQVPGATLIAKDVCKTFEEAIDSTTDSLRRQIMKYKGKKYQAH